MRRRRGAGPSLRPTLTLATMLTLALTLTPTPTPNTRRLSKAHFETNGGPADAHEFTPDERVDAFEAARTAGPSLQP